ncbi:cellulose binding domain-containing protein [Actinacidiphila yeochonensis]|uniref:cellulose binding domain-containing protein n=1 Tax=Actinacidiphila yeochonensis TaxID=89050 RepID=UPI00389928D4
MTGLNGGTSSGTTAGTTSGTTSGTTTGTTAGSTSGTTAGSSSGTTAGTTSGTSAGATSGTTAGSSSGTTAGTTSGTSAGTTSGSTSGSSGGTTPPVGTSCSARFSVTNSWNGGYQGQVTVANSGTVPLLGWMVMWSEPAGNTFASSWSANFSTMDGQQMAENLDWNGSLAVGASTTFGYVVNGSAPSPAPAFSCQPG